VVPIIIHGERLFQITHSHISVDVGFLLFSLNLFICCMVLCVDYFRVVSKSLKEVHLKENKMIEELQRDMEQEYKLKEEIEVCFSD
jgi:hypothetical protein